MTIKRTKLWARNEMLGSNPVPGESIYVHFWWKSIGACKQRISICTTYEMAHDTVFTLKKLPAARVSLLDADTLGCNVARVLLG
jgi:hypothetical protein